MEDAKAGESLPEAGAAQAPAPTPVGVGDAAADGEEGDGRKEVGLLLQTVAGCDKYWLTFISTNVRIPNIGQGVVFSIPSCWKTY